VTRTRLLPIGALLLASGCGPILGIEDTVLDAGSCELVTQRVFFADKLVENTKVELAVVSRPSFERLAAEIGVGLDDARGHALAKIVKCQDHEPAENADADFDPGGDAATLFVANGDRIALGTSTGVEGLVGALNLDAPVEHAVTAYPDELEVESSRGDVVTRPGEIAFIELVPNSEVMVPMQTVSEWECVGNIDDPQVGAPEITLDIDVQISPGLGRSGVPLRGVRITICRDDAASCQPSTPVPPEDETVTDERGHAQLTVDTGDEGFDAHLLVSGTTTSCD
jgi:hypothetical protein